MSAVADRLRALLGETAVERSSDGLPRAVPDSIDGLALVCGTAHEEGWTMRVTGSGTWLPPDAPADLVVSTRALDRVTAVSPEDLVATVDAGCTLDVLERRLGGVGMWLAIDPPGRPERTLGSVVATGTSGPLRAGYGPVRDHVLGCTLVTGDGRVLRPGGRVVKNVAGFDLTKLQVGAFGAFGVVAALHLRLRAVPAADVTVVTSGPRDALTSAARDLVAANVGAQALELLSPALAGQAEWLLAARCLGTDEGVAAETARLSTETVLAWDTLPPDRATALWHPAARAMAGEPITLRLGVLLDGVDEAIDLVGEQLDEGLVSAGAATGMLRWSGTATADALREIRRITAGREIPMTLERAPWALRRAVGHFGAYREGVAQLVGRLRDGYDPGKRIRVALDGDDR